MIDLVLDDLRGETSECGMALAELAIRIRDLNALEADRAARPASEMREPLIVQASGSQCPVQSANPVTEAVMS